MDTPGTSKVEEQGEKDLVVDNDRGEEEEKGPTADKTMDNKRRFSVKPTVEDTTKKIRLESEEGEETENERLITLDMSKYSTNIRSLTDAQLIEIFNIGVAVKESFTLTVCEKSKFFKKELESQMEPIVKEMGKFQTEMGQNVSTQLIKFTNEATALKTGVLEEVGMMNKELVRVWQKVEPMHDLKEILRLLEVYKTEVENVTKQMQKPAIKGSIGENTVMSILKKNLPHGFTLTDVSRQPGKGDIHVETPDENHFLIEVKDHTKNVPKTEIDKFIKNVDNSHEVKVGLMFSLKTGIANKAKKGGSFQIDSHNTKFLIYVPNAWDQQDIVVWSVLLADELAGMNAALNISQAEKLQKLCEKFKQNVSGVKKCREKMRVLKEAMTDLESNMEPMLQVIEKARGEINDIMQKS